MEVLFAIAIVGRIEGSRHCGWPRRNTAASLRTRTCRWAMRRTPTASAIVTMAGSPSGMAATARAMPVSTISSRSRPEPIPTATVELVNTTRSTSASAAARSTFSLPSIAGRITDLTPYTIRANLVWIAIGLAVLFFGLALLRWLKGASASRLARNTALIAVIFGAGFSWTNFGTFHGSRAVHSWTPAVW